jgi:hypothetical protein
LLVPFHHRSVKAVDGTGHTPIIYAASDDNRRLIVRQVERQTSHARDLLNVEGRLAAHVEAIVGHQEANAVLEKGEVDIGLRSRSYAPHKPVSDYQVPFVVFCVFPAVVQWCRQREGLPPTGV